jgi:dipeptidyl-peptidase-4
MKTIKYTIVAFCSLVLTVAQAQQKKLSVEDAVLKQRTTLAPERLMQLQWIPQTNVFSYAVKTGGKEQLLQVDATNRKVDTVLTIEGFQSLFKTLEVDAPMPQRFPFITWTSPSTFRFMYSNSFYQINIETKVASVLTKVPAEAEDLEFEENTLKTAFTLNNNIAVYDKDKWQKVGDLKKQSSDDKGDEFKRTFITNEGSFNVVNGKAVHRNEFGISKGLFWSPAGNKLAYYKLIQYAVSEYELMNFDTKPSAFEKMKYPMAGAPSHTAMLYVHDFTKNRQFEVLVKPSPDQYLTNIAWSPDEEALYVAVLNRDQNEMKLNQYDGRSGAFVKTLFTETHPKYVEPEHPMIFVKNDPSKFIWMSKRDGYNQLYLYTTKGKLISQLTTAKADVTEFLGFDATGKTAYYMAATNNGLDRQCYALDIATAKSKLLTIASGVHSVVVSGDGKYIIDTYSNTNTPRKTLLVDTKTGSELMLLVNAANPIADYAPCGLRMGSLLASDAKTTLNYRMFYPPQFDSTKLYPLLVYVYGGPHAQMITNSWLGGADMWLYYMAQQGFVVFTLDNRGSGNRGRDFEQATFRKLGVAERDDQLSGIAFLKNQRYIDTARVGVFGWSFGGFMSLGLMTRTDAFKVGVAGGPVVDWSLYEIMYTERYMDKPQDNPEGYKESDMTGYVAKLAGKKMMLIHGTDDDVVLWQHSLTYLKKCVDEGVQVDYFVYPEHKHNVLGKDRVHLMQKVADYFKANL